MVESSTFYNNQNDVNYFWQKMYFIMFVIVIETDKTYIGTYVKAEN